ncbi:MAG: hypothetical protein WA432_05245 [Candidatus Babeliaceae bacterium]
MNEDLYVRNISPQKIQAINQEISSVFKATQELAQLVRPDMVKKMTTESFEALKTEIQQKVSKIQAQLPKYNTGLSSIEHAWDSVMFVEKMITTIQQAWDNLILMEKGNTTDYKKIVVLLQKAYEAWQNLAPVQKNNLLLDEQDLEN